MAAYTDYSIPSKQVIEVLKQIINQRGRPEQIRVDNGPEFTSKTITSWCSNNEIVIKYIQPAEPIKNGFNERLNRTFREGIPDAYLAGTYEAFRRTFILIIYMDDTC